MATLELRLLGVPDVILDGEPVHLNRRPSLGLLAYLAVTRRSHTREDLTALLAGELPTDAARKRLRNALADLVNHGLGPFLEINRRSIGLRPSERVTIDVDRLDAMLSNHGREKTDDFDWASARCDHEFLSGLDMDDAPGFETWLAWERIQRRRQLTTVVDRILESLLWSGQHQRGIDLARRLLVVEPWHEPAHRMLIRMLAREGQLAAAREQHALCREALATDLGIEPQAETVALIDQLRAEPSVIRNNLPSVSAVDGLIGRRESIDTITRCLVDPACRLVSLVGIGGIGKTSVAIAAARRIAIPAWIIHEHPFADGVYLIELHQSPAIDPRMNEADAGDRLMAAIAQALEIPSSDRGNQLDQIVSFLQSRRLLLVLDDVDEAGGAETVIAGILGNAPRVTVVTTSQSALGLADEWTIELAMLPVPTTAQEAETTPASQLLLHAARQAGVVVSESDWPDIVQICRLVGGMPLALTIAASALIAMSPADVARELAHGTALFETVATPHGRATIRSAFNAAIDGLAQPQRDSLPRLAVFPTTFDRAAAIAVGLTFPDLLALSRRSLLERDAHGRYALHPLVRRLAVERLVERPDVERDARSLHAAHFAAFTNQVAPSIDRSDDAPATIARDLANIQAAWDWSVETSNLQQLQQLFDGLDAWSRRAGLYDDWYRRIERAISRLRGHSDDPARAALLTRLFAGAADICVWQGDPERGLAHIADARKITEQGGSFEVEALLSLIEGRLLRFHRSSAISASDALQQARVLASVSRQPQVEARSLLELSYSAYDSEDYRLSTTYLQRAARLYHMLNDRHALARTTLQQARLHEVTGAFAAAQTEFEQSLRIATLLGDRSVEAFSLLELGIIHDVALGRHADADDYFDQASEIAQLTGDPHLDGNIQRARGRNAMRVGMFDHARRHFDHALDRAIDVRNDRAIGHSFACLAQLALAAGDRDTAIDRAQQALQIARDTGRQHAQATLQLVLGGAHEQHGDGISALSAYAQSLALAELLAIPHIACDALTGIANVSLSNDSFDLAGRVARQVADHLLQRRLAGCEEPGRNILVTYRALTSTGDQLASEVLRAGALLISQRAARLPAQQGRRYVAAYADRATILRHYQPITGDGECAGHGSSLSISALIVDANSD